MAIQSKTTVTEEIKRVDDQMEQLPSHMTHDWKQTNDVNPLEQNNNSTVDTSSDSITHEDVSQNSPSVKDVNPPQDNSTTYTT